MARLQPGLKRRVKCAVECEVAAGGERPGGCWCRLYGAVIGWCSLYRQLFLRICCKRKTLFFPLFFFSLSKRNFIHQANRSGHGKGKGKRDAAFAVLQHRDLSAVIPIVIKILSRVCMNRQEGHIPHTKWGFLKELLWRKHFHDEQNCRGNLVASLINSNESWRGRDVEWGRGNKRERGKENPCLFFYYKAFNIALRLKRKITVGRNSGERSTDPCLLFHATTQTHTHTLIAGRNSQATPRPPALIIVTGL